MDHQRWSRQTLDAGIMLFAAFSFGGWIYETVENIFSFGGFYLRKALMLPWCPIYGIGGLILVVVLVPLLRWLRNLEKPLPRGAEVALMGVAIFILTWFIELAGSYVCEMLMGGVPWNYSHAWMNFDSRVAPMYTLRFVVLGLVALYWLYPLVTKWVSEHERVASVISILIVVLFVGDVVGEAAGLWTPIKDLLAPYGIRHW